MTEEEIKAYLTAVYPTAIWHENEEPAMKLTYTFEGLNLTEDDIKTAAVAAQQDQ
jgi:hypothetical protein